MIHVKLGKRRVLGYNLSEVCNYCLLSGTDNSAVSLDLVLIQSGKNLFCFILWLISGRSSKQNSLNGFFNIEEFMSVLIL